MSFLCTQNFCERPIVFPNLAELAKLAIIFNLKKGGGAETALFLTAKLNILVRLVRLAMVPTELIHRVFLNGLDVQGIRIKPVLWVA